MPQPSGTEQPNANAGSAHRISGIEKGLVTQTDNTGHVEYVQSLMRPWRFDNVSKLLHITDTGKYHVFLFTWYKFPLYLYMVAF